MQVTVFGASGRVGRQVVERLVKNNYQVVAFIHHNNPFSDYPDVQIVSGSIADQAAVSKAIANSQAVISTLGSWGSPTKDIVSVGVQNITQAMGQQGISRLITLSGANAFYGLDRPTVIDKLTHTFLGIIAGKILRDGEKHLVILEATNLDWTCIRSPVMTKSTKSAYRLTNKIPSLLASIPQAAAARAVVDQLQDKTHYHQAPVIYRA